MALWLKQEDGTLVEVSGGGGGSFDGEHVPTGDPTDPAMFEALDVGQLLYDGVESDGSDAGPHDHDYLPLSGGTLTGDLTVEGDVKGVSKVQFVVGDDVAGYFDSGGNLNLQYHTLYAMGNVWNADGTSAAPSYTFVDDRKIGLFRAASGVVGVSGDLQVDGQINFGARGAGPIINLFHNPDGSNKYGFGLNTNLVAFWAGGKQVGGFDSLGNLYLDGTVLATRGVAFSIATGINTADVLDRAETATMPVLDDEGVATADADVDVLTVNEVVTAMLAKIKELSAEIKELKGA